MDKGKTPLKAKKQAAAAGRKRTAKPTFPFYILAAIAVFWLFNFAFDKPQDSVRVRVPSDYAIVDGRTFVSAREEFDAALLRMEENICYRGIITAPIEWTGISHGDYTHFWVKNFSYSDVQKGKFPGEDTEEAYRIYHFEYYDVTPDQIEEMKREIDAECEDIFSKIPADADDWETALVVHDEMVKRIAYDHSLSEPYNNNAYGALVRHSAVCSGYSATYKYLMLRLGITADSSQSDTHAWNYFYLPASDPYTDVTWDDMDLTDANGDPYVLHNYFFLTKEEMERLDNHAFKYFQTAPEQLHDNPTPYNYHIHEGYMLDKYDRKALEQIFRRQLEQGSNVLTVRFENEEDYQESLSWSEHDYKVFWSVMRHIGYSGATRISQIDELCIINVLLYPPDA